MKLIVSKCCEAPLKWMARKKKTYRQIIGFSGEVIGQQRILGKAVRAYVCDKCGTVDR